MNPIASIFPSISFYQHTKCSISFFFLGFWVGHDLVLQTPLSGTDLLPGRAVLAPDTTGGNWDTREILLRLLIFSVRGTGNGLHGLLEITIMDIIDSVETGYI